MTMARDEYYTGTSILGIMDAYADSQVRCLESYQAVVDFLKAAAEALPDFVQGKTVEIFDAPQRSKFNIQEQVFDDDSSIVYDVACLEDLDCFSDILKRVS